MLEPDTKVIEWLNRAADICHEIASRDSSYPDFYVFQSLLRLNPNLLIVGANPHGNSSYIEKLREKGIERRMGVDLISGTNMFLDNPDWRISRPLISMFKEPSLFSVLEKAVIMNVIYFNTNKVNDLKKFKAGREMIQKCQELTNEFVYQILKPKGILFLGEDGHKWMKLNFDPTKDTVVRNDEGRWLVQKITIEGIPHYKVCHPSMNFRYNSGTNLDLKKNYFESCFRRHE